MKQIDKSTLQFLRNLKKNNNREWFRDHRPAFESARANFESFVQAVIDEIATFDPIIRGLEAGSCMYRINRDIRFSTDKTIYKTHMGAFIVRGGKKFGDRYAGYYFHVEPSNSMIAGGAYMPPMPWLRAIREKIDAQGDKLLAITRSGGFVKHFGRLEGETLKSAPRGYTSDHKRADLLKMKSYLVTEMLSDAVIVSPGCFETVIKSCKAMKSLNDFLNDY
jgi:uncharacterized protein (TIGR02453 family)